MKIRIRKTTAIILTATLLTNCVWAWQYGELTVVRDCWKAQAVAYAERIMDMDEELAASRAVLSQTKARLADIRAVDPKPMGVYIPHLKRTIGAVLEHLQAPKKQRTGWERLILLTIVQESGAGAYTRQVRGPARGIVQVEPATEREALAWAKRRQPALYERVKALRVPARLDIHEAEYNTAYAIGVAYIVYTMRRVDPSGKNAEALARIYKAKYNTAKGKATVPGVLRRLKEYAVNL